jgi:5-(carboxyamino)imidazole ribonucleotide synthase
MLALAAHPLGIDVTVVDPSEDTPARVVARHIVGRYDEKAALDDLAKSSDVVTFEFENVPDSAVRALSASLPVFPGAEILRVAQDRLFEKSAFRDLGIDTPDFLPVSTQADVEKAFATLGPLVLKTRRLGYDGKGQKVVTTFEAAAGAFQELGGVPLIAEALVPFTRELSVIVCRGKGRASVVYPLFENKHHAGILRESVAPARNVEPKVLEQAQNWARTLVNHFDYVGVLALELFEVNGKLMANECAPRVHNSGHLTIEGAKTSQFENHVRAVAGLPLGSTDMLCPTAMLNCIGKMPNAAQILAVTDAHLHDYGKPPREGRKVGHVTVRAESYAELEEKVRLLKAML